MIRSAAALVCILFLAVAPAVAAREAADAGNPLGLQEQHLDPAFWIQRQPDPERVWLDAEAIAALNDAQRLQDSSLHRLQDVGGRVPAATVRRHIEALSRPISAPRYSASGEALDEAGREQMRSSLALDAIPDTLTPRFGLVLRRSALRGYPTLAPLYREPGDRDIDRLQESALFPGDAVVALHRSRDQAWLFVLSERYAAWIEADAVALGDREVVLAHAQRHPALVVIGRRAHTVSSPEAGALSQLPLEMGVRLPWRRDWPTLQPVNGQLPLAHWVVELPTRAADGSLHMAPALIARSEPLATAALPYSPVNLIRQAFRFLGERYGWGHDLDARDCSGFISEVHWSMGILLPRNSGDQAASPVFETTDLTGLSAPQRQAALASVSTGDLLHLPGHVMLAIGRIDGELWLIHDVHRLRVRGRAETLPINGVAVTPLQPLLDSQGQALADSLTRIQRLRPRVSQ
jgi:cell wall-associated NlpC family hydrolase